MIVSAESQKIYLLSKAAAQEFAKMFIMQDYAVKIGKDESKTKRKWYVEISVE